jgi:DNA repair protein RadC
VLEKSLIVRDVVFDSPALVRQYLALRLSNLEAEVFMVLLLDEQNRLIEARELFRGTVSRTVASNASCDSRGCRSVAVLAISPSLDQYRAACP